VFFFFSSRRRHTRSTRDWSSDVCSSDLLVGDHLFHRAREVRERTFGDLHHLADQERDGFLRLLFLRRFLDAEEAVHLLGTERHRSEERRVGKECSIRMELYILKKKIVYM